ncbi:MAG: efflux RND transporter periplasmic adaptor subunit [Rudaea sp.]|uniref:HlyD family secretion protein n=1 Tax=unclassified Rudaea TaxID=2627037 RepID=UPI0010F4EB51|nr:MULTISPECIES: efflux RND transporter periplasmic adaptor subunit [unclassified Rudaea]MBN8886432.1 efflux RND transporter periplasmic adaptor subunit [Rudaea sp.]
MSENKSPPLAGPSPVRRSRRLLAVAVASAIVGGAYAVYAWTTGDLARSTDDAYVGGHSVVLTPQVAGVVTAVRADDTDRVAAGDVLVELDAGDARIEFDAAQAHFADAVRQVRGLSAAVDHADAEVQVARTALDRARADLRERLAIADSGALTGEDVRHARDGVKQGEALLAAAERARALAATRTQGAAALTDHPEVRAAIQRLRAAALALERTRIVAPAAGMVHQRRVQVGRRVAPGEALLTVVPLDRLWVDANFKEVQLDRICAGQPATLTADVYGASVRYRGKVEGIEAGSGAAFALLPAQNATGNWIKVVQRVPVRIAIEREDLAAHPLRVGVSMRADIDVRDCPKAAASSAAWRDETDVYVAQVKAAEARVAGIVAALDGGASAAGGAP